MSQKAFCVDLGRCIGCNACVIACKEFRGLGPAVHRRVVHDLPETLVESPLRNYLTVSCNHCADPGCMKNCPAAAYEKNKDGIVLHNKDLCIGCKMCEWTCPYGVPCFDEEAGVMDKCDLCVDRLAEGQEPYCVVSCPLSAIKVMDVSDIVSDANSDYQHGVDGYPSYKLTGANIYVKLPSVVDQVRR